MTSLEAQVLIVGAGPTGMTAAMELTRLGVSVRLVERAAKAATTSRAIGVQARTLELFQQRGLTDRLMKTANFGVAGSIYGEGKRTFRLDFANDGSRYGYIAFISQAETEATLREALERQGVTIERELELVALSQEERSEKVEAVLRHKDGRLEEVACAYLIDCEGAHSVARTTLGFEFAGKTREEDYVLGDLHIDGDLPSTDFHIFSSEHGFMGLFPMGGGRFRLIASNPLSTPEKGKEPGPGEIQTIYNQRSHIPARFHDMSWSSYFRINSRMVDKLSSGRVFLGGDAAHIHSPAGAQGMNTGIQDMINLAWKIALVERGVASPRLLETYNLDRFPVIHDVLTKTEGLTDAIGSENKLFRSVFSHLAPWIVSHEFVQQNATERMSQVALGYRKSPLSVTKRAVGEIKAGDRLPDLDASLVGGTGQPNVAPKAVRLFDVLQTDCFTLLYTNLEHSEAVHQATQAGIGAWRQMLETASIRPRPGLEAGFEKVLGKAPGLILVRPDGYAAFTSGPQDLDALSAYLSEWFPQDGSSKKGTA